MKKRKYYFQLIFTPIKGIRALTKIFSARKTQKIMSNLLILSILMIWCNAYANPVADNTIQDKKEVMKKAFRVNVPFIANEGQIHKDASFYVKTFGGTLYVTEKGEMIYSLPKKSKISAAGSENVGTDKPRIDTWVLKESLVGSHPLTPEGVDRADTEISYFRGKDPAKWRSHIPTYNRLSLGRIYNGITLSLKAYGKNVEKIFTVLPGGKVGDIRVKIDGTEAITVAQKGDLEVQTGLGLVRFSAPLAYQVIDGTQRSVMAAYDVKGNTYGFRVAEYDRRYPLIIDPLLASTFIGGTSSDWANAAVLDSSNNVYITGYTESSDFPTPAGAYSGTLIDYGYDVFVAKLSSDFTSLQAATYIGGSGQNEYVGSIALDSGNNVYIAGTTDSDDPDDFPTTLGAYDRTHNGWRDVFVCKFSNNLSSLEASTLMGGSGHDHAYSIAIDGSDKIYISGYTGSSEFPTSTGAYDRDHNGGADVFVARLSNGLSSLEASTFFGGSANDHGFAIAADGSSNVWVSGWTNSSNLSVTTGVYDETFNGGDADVFIACFSSSLSDLEAATYLGGSGEEKANDIKVAPSGAIYVAGYTESTDFPTTSGAYDETHNGSKDVFVSKLTSDLTTLNASTYLGGNAGTADDEAHELAIDPSGNVYLAGETTSQDFPTTAGAYDTIFNEGSTGSDAFVAKLNSDLTLLQRSTFLGGLAFDESVAVSLDGAGNVYVVGTTIDEDFPVTDGAYDETWNDWYDVFVSKLDADLSSGATPPAVISTTPAADATDVADDTSIYAEFTTAMDPATITTSTFLVNDGTEDIAGLVSYEGVTARFTPAAHLDYSHTYTARITTDVTDLAGTPMADEHIWTFQTVVLGNNPPDKPTLVSPADGATNISLTPALQTGDFTDPDSGNTHLQTRWQISKLLDFSALALDVTCTGHLTTLTVPASLLEAGTTYYWRAMFFDNLESGSEWSEPYLFTTVTNSNDTDPENGIPDDQEVDNTVDLDDDGDADINQSDIRCVDTATGDGQIGIKGGSNVSSIECLTAVDPETISDTTNKPDSLPLGLVTFNVHVDSPGDTAEVTVYLSAAAASGAGWYKYDSINGWQDYSAHAAYSTDRRSVTLALKDGDYGDADGTANGIIVDPGGPVYSSSASTTTGDDDDKWYNCFIATAAYGSLVDSPVVVLSDFRDRFLLNNPVGRVFVRLYYTCSLPVADFIARHDAFRTVVRVGLTPMVGIRYVALHTTTVQKIMLILLAFGLLLAAVATVRAFRKRKSLILQG